MQMSKIYIVLFMSVSPQAVYIESIKFHDIPKSSSVSGRTNNIYEHAYGGICNKRKHCKVIYHMLYYNTLQTYHHETYTFCVNLLQ